jgi:hypothetical protein
LPITFSEMAFGMPLIQGLGPVQAVRGRLRIRYIKDT